MTVQSIQAHDLAVKELFQAFYTVPDYQREYVWQSAEVEQLLNDINGELDTAAPGAAPEYFIGSIVVCPRDDGTFELIDGQQRMTTMFLILCAIRDRLHDLGQSAMGPLDGQIAAGSVDVAGCEQFRYRLDLQYEDSGDVLVLIAGRDVGAGTAQTRSIANIRNAYDVAHGFLVDQFNDDANALRAFYGYLTNKVKLIRIQTEDVAKALKIFETINDRGVGLNSMDLLKNLLFMKANREQFGRLKDVWKELQDTIFDMAEKPLRFLRYFIFSRYDVEILREDEIYGWLTKNEAVCGYARDPLGFAGELKQAAIAYRRFMAGEDQHGRRSQHLQSLRLLGGSAARQHLILLLAGRHLSADQFDRLCQEVENLFFVYVITHQPTRDFERSFARWAIELRQIETDEQLDEFVERRFVAAKRELSARFDDAMRRLRSWDVQKYRLRYILAKLTQRVDMDGFGDTEGTRWLNRYTGSDFEIEHIFPQTPSPAAAEEFGELQDTSISCALGNLVLAEKSINASLGNRAYSEKRGTYCRSQALLTRALAERVQVGTATRIDTAVEGLAPFEQWSEAMVQKRQDQLADLAFKVWDVPPPWMA